ASRTWNVGYIRTPNAADAARNSYGSTLADLTQIIRDAPETKRCLVRRMASYFLGDKQVYDGSWLAGLTAAFDEPAGAPHEPGHSSAAFKAIVAALVQSNAFVTPDPQPDQCYDTVPGSAPSSLPCPVRFVIENNCVSCHNARGAA